MAVSKFGAGNAHGGRGTSYHTRYLKSYQNYYDITRRIRNHV